MSATSAIHAVPDAPRNVVSRRIVPPPVVSSRARNRGGSSSGKRLPYTRKAADVVSIDGQMRTLARSIAQAAVEVLAGTRPAQQLSRSLDPRCLTALQHRAALTRAHAARAQAGRSRLHRNPLVRSVRVCAVKEGVYEASLVVSEELRSRAVAMRLEGGNGVWKVTALEIG